MITNEERLERLQELRDIMQRHHEADGQPAKLNGVSKYLDMNTWCCETSACAFGSHALSPGGKAKGLQLVQHSVKNLPGELDVRYETDELVVQGMDAAAAFYGLDDCEVLYLFDPSNYEDEVMELDESEVFYDEDMDRLVPARLVLERIDEVYSKYENGMGAMQT